MAGRDVPDLVAQHERHLRLGVEQAGELAGDVDIAARDREGVAHRRI